MDDKHRKAGRDNRQPGEAVCVVEKDTVISGGQSCIRGTREYSSFSMSCTCISRIVGFLKRRHVHHPSGGVRHDIKSVERARAASA